MRSGNLPLIPKETRPLCAGACLAHTFLATFSIAHPCCGVRVLYANLYHTGTRLQSSKDMLIPHPTAPCSTYAHHCMTVGGR